MLTYEEMLICHRELAKRGYRYVWYNGSPSNGYWLLARKHPPLSVQGLRERPIRICQPEDLVPFVEK